MENACGEWCISSALSKYVWWLQGRRVTPWKFMLPGLIRNESNRFQCILKHVFANCFRFYFPFNNLGKGPGIRKLNPKKLAALHTQCPTSNNP